MTTTNVQPNPNAHHWLSLFEGNTATRLQEDKPLAPKATITLAPQGPGVTGAVHLHTQSQAQTCDNRPPGAQVRQPAAGRTSATTGLFGGVARRKYATTGRRAQTCDNRPPGAQVRQPAHGGNYAQTHFEHFFRLRLQLCFSRLISSQSQSYMECSRYRCCLKERPLRGCRRTSPLRPRPH